MPHRALANFDATAGRWGGSRIRWVRWAQNITSGLGILAFGGGFVFLLIDSRQKVFGLALCAVGFVAIGAYFFATSFDWLEFGRVINRKFARATATIQSREEFATRNPHELPKELQTVLSTSPMVGWRSGRRRPWIGVRLRGSVPDGTGAREVEIVPSLIVSWDNAEARDRYLAARIRPDGTCEVALDPELPDRAYLLPWS